MSEDTFEAAVAATKEKVEEHISEFLDFVQAQSDLIATGTCLLSGQSDADDYQQCLGLVRHVEQLWRSACLLFKADHFPQSAFLALSCIEEVGKVGVVRFQLLQRMMARGRNAAQPAAAVGRRRGNPFYSHTDKQLLAAGAGAVVNSRLARILGREIVSEFLVQVRNREIEPLRQAALYADVSHDGPALPSARFGKTEAEMYCVLAGELMAEVLGFEPAEWNRLIETVQQFEREIGRAWE